MLIVNLTLHAGRRARVVPVRAGRAAPATLERLSDHDQTDRDGADPVAATTGTHPEATDGTRGSRPGGPPSALARNVVVGLLIAFVAASNLGNLFLSVLVTERPLLFIGLNAQNRNLALASGELDAVSFYVVGFLRLVGPDPLFFLLGRWYGDGAIRWMERRAPSYGELLRVLETWFDKARLLVVAIAPNNPVCLFAGAAGMTWGAFMVANVVGTVVRLVAIRMFSSAFENQLGSLRDFIGEYRWEVLAVSFLAVGFTIWNDHRGGREDIGDLLSMDDDIAEAEADRAVDRAAGGPGTDQGTAG